MGLWADCSGIDAIQPIYGHLVRVVECQEQVATNQLVDTLDEQAVLEQLLEDTKPVHPPGCAHLHYLLATPFRYPPLKKGSRFGGRHEPSLFYGSLQTITALAEAAYYRFLFWAGMEVPPQAMKITSQHTLFGADYSTERGIQLQAPPFDAYTDALIQPADYAVTQALGTDMAKANVEGFEYLSARDPDRGINVALYTPDALASDHPLFQQQWLCETRPEQIRFYSKEDDSVHAFPLDTYLVDGHLPTPAF